MKNLLLIDASALVYRFFYALPSLTTPAGEPIQGIYGLANVLLKIMREQKPDYAAAALDRPEKTFREEQFKEYKTHRPPIAEALVNQLKRLPEIFSKFGVKTFERAGFEADDLIGTLAERFSSEPNLHVIVLSGDLDMLQLAKDEKIVIQIIKTGLTDTEKFDAAGVEAKYGLRPEQLPDYKGLVGDASDNIPGVKGIGPKAARELLQEFISLDGIYENFGLIKDSIAKKLAGQEKEVRLYRELARIKKDVPVHLPLLEELRINPLSKEQLIAYFSGLGFESLVKRLAS